MYDEDYFEWSSGAPVRRSRHVGKEVLLETVDYRRPGRLLPNEAFQFHTTEYRLDLLLHPAEVVFVICYEE
jgi:hypothetical protein